MNQTVRGASPAVRIAASACPHDCPSTCALEVEVSRCPYHRARARRGRQPVHRRRHLRQSRPLRRTRTPSRSVEDLRCAERAAKDQARSPPIAWDDAPRLLSPSNSCRPEQRHGSQAVVASLLLAGTMGLVMRDGINRLRHVKKYSGFHGSICVNPSYCRVYRRNRAGRRSRPARKWRARTSSSSGERTRSTLRST